MVQKKLEILQLSPQFPFPMTDGGKIGIANIYKEYYRLGHKVTFCAFAENEIQEEYLDEAKKYGDVRIIRHSTKNTPAKILGSLFKKQSLYTSKHFDKSLLSEFENIIESKNIDILHCDHSAMMPVATYLKNKYSIPVALRLHNIEWTIWDRYASVIPSYHPKSIYISSQSKKLKRDETKYYSIADVCFAITEEDKKRALQMVSKANVCVATAGVNLEEWKPSKEYTKSQNTLVLATNYDWVHNVDGVIWFIESVLPLVKEHYPDTKLQLIGKNPPERLKQYADNSVEILGFVPSVKEYLQKANVYIAPLFVGGGIRIKILEAMAMQLPVVATSVSAEGIKASNQDGLYVSDSAEVNAKFICDLLSNKQNAEQSGRAARAFIANNHTWEKSVGIMSEEMIKII